MYIYVVGIVCEGVYSFFVDTFLRLHTDICFKRYIDCGDKYNYDGSFNYNNYTYDGSENYSYDAGGKQNLKWQR